MACAEPNADPFPQPPSIKGLQVQMTDDALKLGLHHAAINVSLGALMDLERKPENPRWTVDGEVFSFNESYLKSLDGKIQPLSEANVVVYVILLAYPTNDAAKNALMIHPNARADGKYQVAAFNTVTEAGRRWLQAVGEFLADRWSGKSKHAPRVWGWIVGNEVNSHWLWYNMGLAKMETVADEHEKAVRIFHKAVRKSSRHARVYLSFDHHWAGSMHGISPEEATPGRDFLDVFARIARKRGDFDWHVAHHPYPEDLGNPRVWADKNITFDENTIKVTFKNLEVLTRYLEKPELRYEGTSRRVILSEQGFHTLDTPEGEKLQAAAFAYAWEKCRRLPAVDAFIYHRHVDHAHEGGLRLGLWRNAPDSVATPHSKKQLYDLFQKAGTPEWETAAAFALEVAGLKSWDELAPQP